MTFIAYSQILNGRPLEGSVLVWSQSNPYFEHSILLLNTWLHFLFCTWLKALGFIPMLSHLHPINRFRWVYINYSYRGSFSISTKSSKFVESWISQGVPWKLSESCRVGWIMFSSSSFQSPTTRSICSMGCRCSNNLCFQCNCLKVIHMVTFKEKKK